MTALLVIGIVLCTLGLIASAIVCAYDDDIISLGVFTAVCFVFAIVVMSLELR